MPLDASVVGTVEAYSTVSVRAQITGELTAVNFQQGDDVTAGQELFTLDRRPLEGGAAPGASQSRARHRARPRTPRPSCERYEQLVERGIVAREQRDNARTSVATARSHAGLGSRRGRERESAAAVRDDQGADLRPHRRADGERRQPRARQRSDAARHDQPGHADLRVVRVPRAAAARSAPLHGARRAAASKRGRRAATITSRSARSPSSTTPSI